MKKLCIQTLVHDHELAGYYLKLTIDSFFKNTFIPDEIKSTDNKVDWFIRLNGTNENLNKTIDYITEKYSGEVNWNIFAGDNIGVGAGINFINTHCQDYEFTFFIEGDWICMDNVNKDWLSASLKLLIEYTDVDLIFFRRYLSDYEDRQNGMSEWVNSKSFVQKIQQDGIDFILLTQGVYTNNPSIRRQKSLYDKKIFPLNEYYDDKGNPSEVKKAKDWGRAEVKARFMHLKTLYLWPGIFNHENRDINNMFIDGHRAVCSECKYGFLFTSKWFCLSCSKNDEFYNLSNHTTRGIQTLLDPIHHNKIDMTNLELVSSFVENIVDNPTLNIVELVKKYYGRMERDFSKI